MAAELALPLHAHDIAWSRLAIVVPAVLAAWLLVLWVLGVLLAREPLAPPPKPIDAMLFELPGEPAPPREVAPPAPPPPVVKPTRPVPKRPPPAPALAREPEAPVEQPSAAPPAPPPPPAETSPAAAPQAPAAVHAGPTPARAIFNPLPRIPDELRERASTADALARFDIRADGTASVALIAATPDPLLNRVLLETLRTWRFFPATENGRPVASSQEIRIRLEVR